MMRCVRVIYDDVLHFQRRVWSGVANEQPSESACGGGRTRGEFRHLYQPGQRPPGQEALPITGGTNHTDLGCISYMSPMATEFC